MAQAKMYDAAMSPNKLRADDPTKTGDSTGDKTGDTPRNEDMWLMIARDAYIESESYFTANIRKNLERNLAHFANRHAPGSKYYGASYKHRHKGFRPKTRSMVRRNEAAATVAMFSTSDIVTVKAARSSHPSHRISAEINQSLLQYRLENTIKWYQTVVGAYQETLNNGLCISYQYWDYEELSLVDPEEEAKIGPEQEPAIAQDKQSSANNAPEESTVSVNKPGGAFEDEDPMDEYMDAIDDTDTEEPPVIVRDTPACDLRPIENVFFHVGCDWRDPANTSPFIIDKFSMTIDEVKLMAKPSAKNHTPWVELTESQLLTGATTDYDSVRRQREENREDSKDRRHLYHGFDTVWIHRNIIKKYGRDWIFYTLGIHYRLSAPIPLTEEYTHLKEGERPYVFGFSNIEAHKNYPDSIVGLAASTQQEANEINNQRRDNVALSLNRRYIVKRGAMIDYSGLQRNVPGGVTEVDDPTNDIRIEAPPDVTSSAYEEQDRVNMDFDELTGMFSSASVSTNRNMNETVGGMKLLAGDADALTEYPLRTFVITWVVPVLKQILRLEQAYESDGALLNLIGEKLKLWQKHGIDRITDDWIQGSMNIQVNVGFGATDPQQRVNRLATGLGTIFAVAPQMQQKLDGNEVAKEVLGALGYAGSDRFFPEQLEAPAPQGPQKGDVTEQDQAKLDQDFQMHTEKMEAEAQRQQWEIEKHYDLLESKAQERVLKQELSDTQFEEKMARIQTDRQNAVDEMKLKLKLGSGI